MAGTSSESTTAQGPEDLRLWVLTASMACVCHVCLAVVFYGVGLRGYGHSDVVAALIHLSGLGFILSGRRILGAWVVLGSASIHVAFFHMAMGPGLGWLPFLLALLVVPLLLFRGEGRHMLSAIALISVSFLASMVGAAFIEPWLVFDPRVETLLRTANLLLVVICVIAAGLGTWNIDRRHQAELARLREAILQARRLGQYTLGEKLGAGGMGQVYRAKHALLRRPAAIKLIKDGEVSDEVLERFEREVQRTSELSHPNTIEIYDYGRTPEGIFYYVMEYLDGLDLEDLVAEYGAQPPERVVHLCIQACEALEEAHEAGLVHRDIKPANLFLCRRGLRPDVVKVLDFGLVKEVDDEGARGEHGILGTPAYLAPEALEGPASVGPSADLYALGATAYFLLCGETVFEADNVFALCTAHLSETPRPVSERTKTAIPEPLESLVMGCLAKEPARRPTSAGELREGLEAIAREHPWTEAQARAWWAEHVAKRETQRAAEPAVEGAGRAPREPDSDATLDVGALRRTELA